MRGCFLIGLLVMLPVVAAAQAEPAAETFEQQLAKLRMGLWSEARAEGVIGTLLEREQFVAAGWWLEEVDGAIHSKNLPRTAKRRLAGLGKKYRAGARRADLQAYKLADNLARHAADVVNKKNYKEAEEAVACARRFLVFFPSSRGKTQLKRARGKLPTAEKRFDRGHKVLMKQREKTKELVAAAQSLFETRWVDFVGAYRQYGNFASYVRMRGLVMLACPAEKQQEVLRGLREATVKFHGTEKLTLWVIGLSPVRVILDGEEVGAQSEMWRKDSGTDAPPWKPIQVQVLPGDMIRFRGPDHEISRRMARGILIHARFGRRDVPKSCYYAVKPDRPTSLGPAEFGEMCDTPTSEFGGGGKGVPTRGMRFSGGTVPGMDDMPAEMSIVPILDEVFDWFKKQGVPFIGAQGSKERPVLVLMVPDHAE